MLVARTRPVDAWMGSLGSTLDAALPSSVEMRSRTCQAVRTQMEEAESRGRLKSPALAARMLAGQGRFLEGWGHALRKETCVSSKSHHYTDLFILSTFSSGSSTHH